MPARIMGFENCVSELILLPFTIILSDERNGLTRNQRVVN